MKRITAALISSALLVMVFAPGASATDWSSVEEVSARVGQACAGGTKIEINDDFVNGTVFGLGENGAVRIWIHSTPQGETLEFVTDTGHAVSSVIVKGGPVALPALKYNYVPATQGDNGLHSRLNLNNNKWYGVSFACFQSSKVDHQK
jgi:hypothetical protein